MSRLIASGSHAPGEPEVISKDGPGTRCAGVVLLVNGRESILGVALGLRRVSFGTPAEYTKFA